MANNIKIDKKAIGQWLKTEPTLKEFLLAEAEKVADQARATASEAENGAGGNIDGYAAAGFSTQIEIGSKRMAVIIKSNADPKIALAAHFYTQRKNGIGHLRAALYRFTNVIGVTKYPVGKDYETQFGQARSNAKK